MQKWEWEMWKSQVLTEMERMNAHLDRLERDEEKLAITVGKLQLVAAATGALAGIIATGLIGGVL